MTIGDKIKTLRKEHNLTQTELGKILGIEKSTVSMYENNRSTPNDDIKIKIAKYFNISVDYLIGFSDIRNPYELLEKEIDPLTANIDMAAHRESKEDFSKEEIEELRELMKIARENKNKK
ncbi:helix-turn-helix domain-containing protein [Miniphocaeibacter massiliensis]|uniref:helix-turn-helix domain-containing protein n=1 Tax=Miniphocaeibacter massiliensis TaxID=2041841 RepID=UPI000C1BAC2F|nr:helix-turn-helix domain-containing protein [Miniphocaeibacter massiliensis]